MTPEEIREKATEAPSKEVANHWLMVAELCERLDQITEQLKVEAIREVVIPSPSGGARIMSGARVTSDEARDQFPLPDPSKIRSKMVDGP